MMIIIIIGWLVGSGGGVGVDCCCHHHHYHHLSILHKIFSVFNLANSSPRHTCSNIVLNEVIGYFLINHLEAIGSFHVKST
jgi:hypothetical protein